MSMVAHASAHGSTDDGEVADNSIVHAAMTTPDERMIVNMNDGSATRSPDVSEDYTAFGVRTDRSKVDVVDWGRDGLVCSRSQSFFLRPIARFAGIPSFKISITRRVPGNT